MPLPSPGEVYSPPHCWEPLSTRGVLLWEAWGLQHEVCTEEHTDRSPLLLWVRGLFPRANKVAGEDRCVTQGQGRKGRLPSSRSASRLQGVPSITPSHVRICDPSNPAKQMGWGFITSILQMRKLRAREVISGMAPPARTFLFTPLLWSMVPGRGEGNEARDCTDLRLSSSLN